MQEGTRHRRRPHVTSSKQPFFVMATQNPIEQEGTYPLPEAQLDRFFFKLIVGYSDREELATIVDRTTRGENIEPVQGDGRRGDPPVAAAGPRGDPGRRTCRTTSCGWCWRRIRRASSPRRSRTSISAGAPVRARRRRWPWRPRCGRLLEGRYNVSFEDVRRVYLPAMRHRVILNFEAQAEGIETDQRAAGTAGEGAGEGRLADCPN